MSSPQLFLLSYPLIAADDKPAGSPSVRVKCAHHRLSAAPRSWKRAWKQALSTPPLKAEQIPPQAEAQLALLELSTNKRKR